MEKFEKIFKREDGTRIKVCCFLETQRWYPHTHEYQTFVMKALPKKRKWITALDGDYTKEEVYKAELEYWETLKPTLR